MAADEQGDDQAGDHRVLADDGLGDLAAQGEQRRRGASGGCLRVGHGRRTCLSSASRSVASATSAASSAGSTVQEGRDVAGAPAGPGARPTPTTASGLLAGRQPERAEQPGQRRRAQVLGGAVAGPAPAVQPGAPLGRLGRPDDDRQRLVDDRAEPAPAPERDEQHDDDQLEDHDADPVREQVAEARGAVGRRASSSATYQTSRGVPRGGSARGRRCRPRRGASLVNAVPEPDDRDGPPVRRGPAGRRCASPSGVAGRRAVPIGGGPSTASPPVMAGRRACAARRSQAGSRHRSAGRVPGAQVPGISAGTRARPGRRRRGRRRTLAEPAQLVRRSRSCASGDEQGVPGAAPATAVAASVHARRPCTPWSSSRTRSARPPSGAAAPGSR